MVAAAFDSNVRTDFLRGLAPAGEALEAVDLPAISIVTWIEVLAGAPAPDNGTTRRFLARFDTLPLGPDVAESALLARVRHRLKLPDAIVLATAQSKGLQLFTRDEKGFGRVGEGIVLRSRLESPGS